MEDPFSDLLNISLNDPFSCFTEDSLLVLLDPLTDPLTDPLKSSSNRSVSSGWLKSLEWLACPCLKEMDSFFYLL